MNGPGTRSTVGTRDDPSPHSDRFHFLARLAHARIAQRGNQVLPKPVNSAIP
jgi:hypothetical protein